MRTHSKILAIAAAGGALAIGVPTALAVGDSPDTPPTRPVQNAQPQQERPDRDDCPEKGRDQSGSTAPDATATPDV